MVDQNKGFVGGVTLVSLDLLIHLTHGLICPHSFLFTFFGTSSLIWYCVICPIFLVLCNLSKFPPYPLLLLNNLILFIGKGYS